MPGFLDIHFSHRSRPNPRLRADAPYYADGSIRFMEKRDHRRFFSLAVECTGAAAGIKTKKAGRKLPARK